jgi:hypothetical protein
MEVWMMVSEFSGAEGSRLDLGEVRVGGGDTSGLGVSGDSGALREDRHHETGLLGVERVTGTRLDTGATWAPVGGD